MGARSRKDTSHSNTSQRGLIIMGTLEETRTKLHFSTFPTCQLHSTVPWASLIPTLSQQPFLHADELFLKNAAGTDHSYFSHKECRSSCSTYFSSMIVVIVVTARKILCLSAKILERGEIKHEIFLLWLRISSASFHFSDSLLFSKRNAKPGWAL